MSQSTVMSEFRTLPESGELMEGVKLTLRIARQAGAVDVCWFQPASSALPQIRQIAPQCSMTPADRSDCEELALWFLRSGQAQVISPNVKVDAALNRLRATRRAGDVRGFSAWRIRTDDQTVGALCMAQFGAAVLSADALRCARDATQLLSIWFGAMHTALFDEMTGLLERGYAETMLEKALRRSQRRLEPVTFAMLDVDHFKALNDALGHPAGDRALAGIAKRMSAHFERAGDLVARWGGEEFLILQADSGHDEAVDQIQTLLDAVRAAEIVNPDSETGVVTLSAGVVSFQPEPSGGEVIDPGQLLGRLVKCADEALYQAKQSGRDRLVDAGAVRWRDVQNRSSQGEGAHGA